MTSAAVLLPAADAHALRAGDLPLKEVIKLHRRALKIARYLPLFSPVPGCDPAIEAEGRLTGLLLLPMPDDGIWRGADENMNNYEIRYDQELGLLAGKVL